jgi:molecular chaperone DnaK
VLGLLPDEDGAAVDIEVELRRQQLEAMLAAVRKAALQLLRRLLAELHFTPDLIDQVLMVGGSSCIPCFAKDLQEEFGQDKVLLHERPMLAVAEGAAILSHRLADAQECPGCGGEAGREDAACPHCGFDLEAYTADQGLVDIVHAAAHDYFIRLENEQRFLMIEKNTPLPCFSTEFFQLVAAEQELVHIKFFNSVNDREESIGDLWLGIDRDGQEEEEHRLSELPRVAVTLDIDENNLVSVRAALVGQPDVKVAGTLSRGKADEKLFLSLEQTINEADQKGYSTYTVTDLLNRARAIIRLIHQVVDPETGAVDEALRCAVEEKISKAVRIAEAEEAPLTRMYYAESMLEDYGKLIKPELIAQIEKKIKVLRQADEDGTYEETMQAMENLARLLEDPRLELVHALTQIENACEICYQTDPGKAKRFMRATADVLASAETGGELLMDEVFAVMPEVEAVLDEHARRTQKIYRDIRK